MTIDDRGAVRLVEVSPRDGLQNEPAVVPTPDKVRLIEMLADAGLRDIEATSFVSPSRVPQVADAEAVLAQVQRRPGVRFSALVPNPRGLERALAVGVQAIALLTAASETFTQRNIGMSIAESLRGCRAMMPVARAEGLWVRAYVSTAFVCPYEGAVLPERVAAIVGELAALGVDEVSVGDTIGRAEPDGVEVLLRRLAPELPVDHVACHFHDTAGRAIENVRVALDHGVRVFDAAVAGAGGCPFAPGAPGNLATESLLAMLRAEGWYTGVDAARLAEAGQFVRSLLVRGADVRPAPRQR